MIGNIIKQLGVPALVRIIKGALEGVDDPVSEGAKDALEAYLSAVKSGQITQEKIAEANRHAEALLKLEIEREGVAFTEINHSLRAEIASNDKYVRRMRPTFGYLMALTWAAQMLGAAYVIIFKTEESGQVLSALNSLTAIWTVGLSVLGIYVYKRSREKMAGIIES